MPSNHLILCCPLLLPPSIFPSIRVFSNETVLLIRWPKYWTFSFSNSPCKEYSWLISFRMDWLDLLAVQGTTKRLQHHSSKASILQCSAFFIVQVSHPYTTTGFSKTRLNIWTFTVHVLLKPALENFEHYFASMRWVPLLIVWAFFGIAFLWDWNENWHFPVLWPLLSFPDLLAYWV